MQTLMIKNGSRYRKATVAEVSEVAGFYAREAMNKERPTLAKPSTAVRYLQSMYAGVDHETFTVIFLDSRFQLIECVEMFRGTVNQSAVYPREIAKEALWRGAAAVVLAHNHPSNKSDPSTADIMITQAIKNALALIDVRVLDHLIIGSAGNYCSLAERGDM